jgi:hypothetical protein
MKRYGIILEEGAMKIGVWGVAKAKRAIVSVRDLGKVKYYHERI